jgi:hypothetical protein
MGAPKRQNVSFSVEELEMLDRVIKEMKEDYGIELSKTKAIRMLCTNWFAYRQVILRDPHSTLRTEQKVSVEGVSA